MYGVMHWPWREVAGGIEQRLQPGDMVMTFYDSTIARYAHFPSYTDQRPDLFPRDMQPLDEWPANGRRSGEGVMRRTEDRRWNLPAVAREDERHD